MKGRMKSVLESFVIGAIFLVLIQTFLEDFAVLMAWTWDIRMVLVYTGFFFDLFFTVEFLARLYVAVYNGTAGRYFFKERGWIDFLASIPLLLLSSGPAVLTLVTGSSVLFALGGLLNVLKVVKAVRIARILRLLRVLKVFKQIKYADSVMAQRHVTKLTAMSVTLFVLLLFATSLVLSLFDVVSVDEVFSARYQATANRVVREIPEEGRAAREYLESLSGAEDLLLVKNADKTVYSAYENDYYRLNYGPSDYQYITVGEYRFYFDMQTLLELQAKDNLVYFAIVVIFVVFLLVVYSPHFALTVSDPIQVMRKGIEDESYNLEVKIPEQYKDDDIYRLADSYNRVFLPLKDRNRDVGGATMSVLGLEDLKDILGED